MPNAKFARLSLIINSMAFFAILPMVLWASGCAHAAQNTATHDRSGNVLFNAPPGWRKIPQNQGVAYVPGDLPNEQAQCFIAILPGQELTGNFREWFDQALAASHKDLRIIKMGEVT